MIFRDYSPVIVLVGFAMVALKEDGGQNLSEPSMTVVRLLMRKVAVRDLLSLRS